jgi:uncharacterized protein YjiS (DUF1127 family)
MSGSRADFGIAIERQFARSTWREKAGISGQPRQGDLVMIQSPLVSDQNETRREDRRFGAGVAARALDMSVQHRSPLLVSLDAPLTKWAPDRPEPGQFEPSSVVRRIIAAIRLWRRRARSRQELRRLSDHMLKDIGLSRAEVGYEFPGPFYRFD